MDSSFSTLRARYEMMSPPGLLGSITKIIFLYEPLPRGNAQRVALLPDFFIFYGRLSHVRVAFSRLRPGSTFLHGSDFPPL